MKYKRILLSDGTQQQSFFKLIKILLFKGEFVDKTIIKQMITRPFRQYQKFAN